jgi:histidine ammonia-lyase
MSAVLLGLGEVRCGGKILPAADGLKTRGARAARLGPKEGLALLNGTQVSTALALTASSKPGTSSPPRWSRARCRWTQPWASDTPFDDRIHQLRGHRGQIETAAAYRELLAGSKIRASHLTGDDKVQDPTACVASRR